mmetsp:Transcript_31416/g.73684  ORF Transcript_31416/g.73684 Transcript_31416/m.73684 type:complete len:305 (+) Transcript_31416:788-1702(+)
MNLHSVKATGVLVRYLTEVSKAYCFRFAFVEATIADEHVQGIVANLLRSRQVCFARLPVEVLMTGDPNIQLLNERPIIAGSLERVCQVDEDGLSQLAPFVEGVAEESALDLVAASGCSIQAGIRRVLLPLQPLGSGNEAGDKVDATLRVQVHIVARGGEPLVFRCLLGARQNGLVQTWKSCEPVLTPLLERDVLCRHHQFLCCAAVVAWSKRSKPLSQGAAEVVDVMVADHWENAIHRNVALQVRLEGVSRIVVHMWIASAVSHITDHKHGRRFGTLVFHKIQHAFIEAESTFVGTLAHWPLLC